MFKCARKCSESVEVDPNLRVCDIYRVHVNYVHAFNISTFFNVKAIVYVLQTVWLGCKEPTSVGIFRLAINKYNGLFFIVLPY